MVTTKTDGQPEPEGAHPESPGVLGQESAPAAPPPVDDGVIAEVGLTNWEFIDRVPTTEDLVALLKTLPPVWGVNTVDYADYVQALPQNKKVKVDLPGRPGVKVDEYHDCYTLYMSVAGRLKMIEAAAEKHGWAVDFEPEPITPTGVPGYISMDPRLVYREYVNIVRWTEGDDMRALGRKPGTAWVPATGGKQAAGSNPYEKVETSARGRALAAWGFGVLPGSGVASVEEILGTGQNRAYLEAETATGQGRQAGAPRKSRADLLQEALTMAEEVRQARGIDEPAMKEKLGLFLTNLGIPAVFDPATFTIDWTRVKDGQVVLLVNSLTDTLRALRDESSAV